MASSSFRTEGIVADKPPPSWKRSTSYIKVSADAGPGPSQDAEQQILSLGRLTAASQAAAKVLPLQSPPQDSMVRQHSTPPVSPTKSSWDDSTQAAATPKTPRLPPPPPSAMSETTDVGAAERQESLTPPASGSGGSAHRRTTSWGGSPTASGRQPHRRSRSIETLGAAGDVRAQAYRLELERIGSMDRASDTSSKASTPRRAFVAVPDLQGPFDSPAVNGQRRPSLPSPLKPAGAAAAQQLPAAQAGLAPPKQVKVKAAGAEPELISWEEVEAQKDVYQAITTPDGRQALVKAAPGKQGAEEVLFLEEAAPLNIPTPAAGSAPVSYALGGPVPMVAVPVQYPDGRVMYHVYPVAQPTAQDGSIATQTYGALPGVGSPQVLSPHVPHGSSPQFPGSPVSVASPTGAGHQRRVSVSALSPLQTGSAAAYPGPAPGAFPSGFAAAAAQSSTVSSPTISSPAGSMHHLQLAGGSSGPLSPALSHGNSGHLIATAVGGAGSAAFGAMSPAGSGQLYGSPSYQGSAQGYGPQAYGHGLVGHQYGSPAHNPQAASPRHEGLQQQMASMQLDSGFTTAKEDPFGGSAVWSN